jgi:hypothetical protein
MAGSPPPLCHQDVDVVITPAGPQQEDLAPDVAAALEANLDAGAFFDGFAQFDRSTR